MTEELRAGQHFISNRQAGLVGLLLCDAANSTPDGKGNLLGIFDQVLLGLSQVPLSLPCCLYVQAVDTIDEGIEVFPERPGEPPDLVLSYRVQPPVPLVAGIPVAIANMWPIALPIEKFGAHRMDVRFGGRSLGRSPLTIVLLQETENGNEKS